MTSIAELAERAQVSKATVSRALAPETMHLVKPATRQKILDICRAMNYVPRSSARALSSGRTSTVGLILGNLVRDFSSPYFAEVISTIISTLKQYRYTLTIIPVPPENIEEADHEVLLALRSRVVDGFIIGSGVVGENTRKEMKEAQVPALALYMPSQTIAMSGVHSVGVDNTEATVQLLRHLAHGKREKAVFISRAGQTEHPRTQQILQLAQKHQFPLDCWEIPCSPHPVQTISTARLAITGDFAALRRYRAWICANDLIALGAVDVLREHGMRPGREIAVTGYDNIEESPNYSSPHPVLTTIAPPRAQLGSNTAQLLMELLEFPGKKPLTRRIAAKLILRESTGTPSPTETLG